MLKTVTLALIAAVIGGTGHVLLAKGMKTVGDLTEAPSEQLSGMVARGLGSGWLHKSPGSSAPISRGRRPARRHPTGGCC